MTIGIGWIRGDAAGGELWLATDSRLSGDGNLWDDCPKLFLLPRRDALPHSRVARHRRIRSLTQVAAVSAYCASASGALEFFDLLGHLERVANSMLGRISMDPQVSGTRTRSEFSASGDVIIIGGFSRQEHGLVLRALQHEAALDRWRFTHVRPVTSLGRNRTLRVFGTMRLVPSTGINLRCLLEAKGTLGNSKPSISNRCRQSWSFSSCPQQMGFRPPMTAAR